MKYSWVLGLFVLSLSAEANRSPAIYWAAAPGWDEVRETLPPCLDTNEAPLAQNNEEVIRWKQSSPNQYKDRALIEGTLVGVLLDRKSHLQLEVDLDGGPAMSGNGDDRSDHIEIIYNKEFGAVAPAPVGSKVAACGDYITAREQSGPYKPSPVGAIVHWVHASTNLDRHQSGFLSVDGRLYGQEMPSNNVPNLLSLFY